MCNAEEFLVAQTGYWHAAATAGIPMFVSMADVESKPIYEIHKEKKSPVSMHSTYWLPSPHS